MKLIQTVKVANHLHGLIFELKERMDSRQDQPVLPFIKIIKGLFCFGSLLSLKSLFI